MIRRIFLLLLLFATVFALANATGVAMSHTFGFKANVVFALEPNAKAALPAGEYFIRDISNFGGVVALQSGMERKHLGFLTVVRVETNYLKSINEPPVVFDYESGPIPVLKSFYSPAFGRLEILRAVYDKDCEIFLDATKLTQ